MAFHDFLCEAQFHGSNRLAERRNRICWGSVLLLLVLIGASVFVVTIIRYLENPAYLAIVDSQETVMKFPSVGICPEIMFPEHKVNEFLDKIYYPPRIKRRHVKAVIQQLTAFFALDASYSLPELKLMEHVLDYNLLSVEKAGRMLTASCEEILLRCRFFGVTKNCSSLFTMELTNVGFCCVFNGRSLTRELRYNDHTEPEPNLQYTTETGFWASLTVIVNNSQRVDDIDRTYKWVFLESGQQFVETVGNGTPISLNTEFLFGYDWKRYVLGENSLKPESRHCRSSNVKLKYFPNYSKRYCRLECEMAQMIQMCHCARINHPVPDHVPRCRASDLMCVKESAALSAKCDCPVTCDSALDIVSLHTYSLTNGNFVIDKFFDGLNFSKLSVVRVFIVRKEEKIHSRQSYYTAEILFGQIGGVFNIFFGCSILTLLELVQLACCACWENRRIRALNRKSQLILPVDVKKITIKNKNQGGVTRKNKLNPW